MDDDPHGLFVLMRGVSRSEIDGAVVELAVRDDGSLVAEMRIPARQPERM